MQVGSVFIKYEDIQVLLLRLDEDATRVGLEVQIRDPSRTSSNLEIVARKYSTHVRQMGIAMISSILGEFDLYMRVGRVHFVDRFDASAVHESFPLVELPEAIDTYFGGRVSPWPRG